jgi:hypothetical protein
MQGQRFAVTVNLHGTLAANARGEFKVPYACSLEGISLSNSANSDMTLDVGTGANRDGILDGKTGGDSGTPGYFDSADWNGADIAVGALPHFAKEDIVAWDLDFDGAAGTAAANVTLIFYFLEG